jgi:hypothetical protein
LTVKGLDEAPSWALQYKCLEFIIDSMVVKCVPVTFESSGSDQSSVMVLIYHDMVLISYLMMLPDDIAERTFCCSANSAAVGFEPLSEYFPFYQV